MIANICSDTLPAVLGNCASRYTYCNSSYLHHHERYELENDQKTDSDDYKKLAKQFGQLHGASSSFNLAALIAAFAYAWELGLQLAT